MQRSSTTVGGIALAWVLLAAPVTNAAPASNELHCDRNDTIRGLVERLGGYETFKKVVPAFSAEPPAAACHLIKGLTAVPEKGLPPDGQEKRPKTMNVVWSLRTLCAITNGLRFTGPTQYRFSPDESERQRRDFLKVKEVDELRFFGVWMSRDVLYIAPIDTQRIIIDKWIRWYLKDGKTFPYRTIEGWETCYFN